MVLIYDQTWWVGASSSAWLISRVDSRHQAEPRAMMPAPVPHLISSHLISFASFSRSPQLETSPNRLLPPASRRAEGRMTGGAEQSCSQSLHPGRQWMAPAPDQAAATGWASLSAV
ncbi:hypothetical protein S40285_10613 [Stachybotrys chlorohalonatus IBT 40285]|uniref:Uncharacterized protein n=1 Tax=Stachybotrys chlorohalonatus (strain IBT 40285) TaxID=1283841 RepID=A0A084QIA7_STAC4|nr:hypothetical protein S40285_10613 [Stachybotrys chlorohalonata IBT 40285]